MTSFVCTQITSSCSSIVRKAIENHNKLRKFRCNVLNKPFSKVIENYKARIRAPLRPRFINQLCITQIPLLDPMWTAASLMFPAKVSIIQLKTGFCKHLLKAKLLLVQMSSTRNTSFSYDVTGAFAQKNLHFQHVTSCCCDQLCSLKKHISNV
jgi:hypothetical protein